MIVLGIRPKTGSATVVLLGGTRDQPHLLDSRVIVLCDPDDEHSRQPYHATFGTEQTDRAVIARLVKGVKRIARKAITTLLREYAKHGHAPRHAVVVASSLTDPASIPNQHMRAHASEGALYRRVVIAGLERAGLRVTVVLERDVLRLAATSAVAALGAAVPRWRAEAKRAAAGALASFQRPV